MSWRDIIRKDTETSTNDAHMWLQNVEEYYNKVLNKVDEYASQGMNYQEIEEELSQFLPNLLATWDDFMDDLLMEGSLDEIDYKEVIDGFKEEIEESIKDYN